VREAHHAAILASDLEVEGLVVVVNQRFGEEPLVVVEPFGPLRDGFVLHPHSIVVDVKAEYVKAIEELGEPVEEPEQPARQPRLTRSSFVSVMD
jgi:hypothetical protein